MICAMSEADDENNGAARNRHASCAALWRFGDRSASVTAAVFVQLEQVNGAT
jgi:hypothetical protein